MKATTLAEFARDPVGRYVGGQAWAHFCAHPTLWGMLLWGRPTEADALALGHSLVLELAPPAQPHASLVDARHLEGGDDGAFAALERYVQKHTVELRHWVQRLALVRPPGLRGALVGGAFEVVKRPYPVKVFGDPRKALEWLAPSCPGLSVAATAGMLAEVSARARGTTPLVASLRGLLDARPGSLGLAQAAAALGVSDRTLQRKLAEEKTSFVSEAGAAKVRAAQRLLEDGDAPLTTVAIEAGFSSQQHLNVAFKRAHGQLPAAWRARRRRGD